MYTEKKATFADIYSFILHFFSFFSTFFFFFTFFSNLQETVMHSDNMNSRLHQTNGQQKKERICKWKSLFNVTYVLNQALWKCTLTSMGSYLVWWPRSLRVNQLMVSVLEKSMEALIPQTVFAQRLLALQPLLWSQYEWPIRDVNGIVSMAVGGSLWLFIIWEAVDKFSRSGRVQHPGREVLITPILLCQTTFLIKLYLLLFVVKCLKC